MSWFASLAETYDKCADIVGMVSPDGNVLLPQNHITKKTDVCITIDGEGKFRHAEKSSAEIAIPCTEDSASRSGSAVFPHPLYDELSYLALDEGKFKKYLSQLALWSNEHPKVAAVQTYITSRTIIEDLKEGGIKEYDNPKLFIRFSVETPRDHTPRLWEDKTVEHAWTSFCEEHDKNNSALCFVTGNIEQIAQKHAKGINPAFSGSKLISSDATNYTFRGRFTKAGQANAISAEKSHKAHAMLRYLIVSQGYRCSTQAIVAWTIDDGSKLPSLFDDSLEIHLHSHKTDSYKLIEAQGSIGFDYAKNLKRALSGMGTAKKLIEDRRTCAVLAVDAVAKGRMSVTFYQEMPGNEYIERICDWHNTCKWLFYQDKREYISSPSGDRIIAAIYGEPKGKSYDAIKKQTRERLLHCIISQERVSRGWVVSALQKASNPFSYNSVETWQNAVAVTCALARKYYNDKEEVFALDLEKERSNRDYLYGRLLALADRLESRARYLQTGKNDTDKRTTNAVRCTQRFASKPFSTWGILRGQLNPYIQLLDGADWYQKQIDEVMSLFESLDQYESDKPLSAQYLMGYSLQRRELFKSNKNETMDEAKEHADESDQEN